MKCHFALFIMLLLSASVSAQTVSESFLQYQARHDIMNTCYIAILSMNLVRTYDMKEQDTTYHFEMHVNHQRGVANTVTLGTSAFDPQDHQRWMLTTHDERTLLRMRRANETRMLSHADVTDLFECANRALQYIQKRVMVEGSNKNELVNCTQDDISVGLEHTPDRINPFCFYLKLGSDAVLVMNRREFERTMSFLNNVMKSWNRIQLSQADH